MQAMSRARGAADSPPSSASRRFAHPTRYGHPYPANDFRLAIPRRARALASIAGLAISVLVVDDDPAFRGLAVRMLARMGFVVVGEAGTIAEATAMAADLRPDAALVDVGLPDGDGVALARTLAALPWRPRVVLTSTDPDATTGEHVRSAGAAGFIPKDDLPDDSLARLLGER
jgi:two-component system nitrate/nitrite response regulator NarL